MRIGIDARMYGHKQGGLGRYLEQLLSSLENTKTNDEFVVFLRSENFEEYEPKSQNFKKVLADISWYGLKEQIKIPKIIREQKIDLMHFPHWNIPLFCPVPFVVTIHDLILLHYPSRRASTLSPIKYFFKNLAFRLVLNNAVKKSQAIIVPSAFTGQDVEKTFKISGNKTKKIHLNPVFKNTATDTVTAKNFLQDKGIKKPFVLYVGVAYPHKNLENLLRAWKIFKQKYGENYQLVLAGKNNYFYERLKQMTEAHEVVFTDYITDSELQMLYSQASLYVFPSLYEGFGLPPLEAMSYQIPVAAAEASCLPEILGNAAFYFNPLDTEKIAEAIYQGLTDQNLRNTLVKNSIQILEKYSSINMGQETLSVYKSVI